MTRWLRSSLRDRILPRLSIRKLATNIVVRAKSSSARNYLSSQVVWLNKCIHFWNANTDETGLQSWRDNFLR